MKQLSEIHKDKKASTAVLKHYAGKDAKLDSATLEESGKAELYGTVGEVNHYVYLHDTGEITHQLAGQQVQTREFITAGGVPDLFKKLGYGL